MNKYIVRINNQPINDVTFEKYVDALDAYTLLKKIKSIAKVEIIEIVE